MTDSFQFAPIKDVIAAIARGEMIVMVDDEDRENEGDLIMAAQFATPEKIAFIVRYSSGVVVAPISGDRCDDLRLPLMVEHNTESHRTAFTISVDLIEGTTTGISAADRAATLRALADPQESFASFARDRKSTRLNPVTNSYLVCRLLLEIGRASCRERVCLYV